MEHALILEEYREAKRGRAEERRTCNMGKNRQGRFLYKIMSYLKIFLLIAVAAGCSSKNNGVEMEMNAVRLTEEQIRILASAGFDEERVRTGELTTVEIRMLEDYEYAVQYLKEKYGSTKIQLTSCTGSDIDGFVSEFYGTAEDFPEKQGKVCVKEEGESRTALDSFYGILMEQEYRNCIEEVLEIWGKTCTEAEVEISGLYDERYDSACGPGLALKEGMYLKGMGYISVDGTGMTEQQCADSAERLQELFAEKGIVGSFHLTFSDTEVIYQKRIHIFASEEDV